jgi:hypothetical protein
MRGRALALGRAVKFVTREHAKVDRIACPWLIRRFVDRTAQIRFVPASEVLRVARETGAISFDAPGAELHHELRGGEPRVTFDAVLARFRLTEPALLDLAEIVRGADTPLPSPRPESAGLAALAEGFRRVARDDAENLRLQFPVYDALYEYCRHRTEPAAEGGPR